LKRSFGSTDGGNAWQMWAVMREARKVCNLMAEKLWSFGWSLVDVDTYVYVREAQMSP